MKSYSDFFQVYKKCNLDCKIIIWKPVSATELKTKKVIVTFYLSILTFSSQLHAIDFMTHYCDYKLTFLIDIISVYFLPSELENCEFISLRKQVRIVRKKSELRDVNAIARKKVRIVKQKLTITFLFFVFRVGNGLP